MALQSVRITKKEITNYYDPKTTEYEYMVNSINSPMGYGQVIQNYAGNGSEVLNTYYHIYSYKIGAPVVYYPTANVEVPELEAGPSFWGVSAQQGLNFLNGNSTILGYRKLKYCNGCLDGNGLNKPVIENFKQRFRQVSEMVLTYNLLEGFLFYDLALPKYQNVFPAVKVDDGVNVDYKFKNVSTGADLTPTDVSTITQKPVAEIETSVDTAPVIKPQEGANTVITSCCDEKVFYVISGQYQVGSILYTTDLTESYCWYVESLTKEEPTVSVTFTSGGRSCKQCVVTYGCPTGCEEVWLSYSSDPSSVCSDQLPRNSYAVDWTTGVLKIYNSGSGGVLLDCDTLPSAPIGYYSDGNVIWFWDQEMLKEDSICASQDNYVISWCCDGTFEIISSPGKPLTPGQIIYFDTKGVYPVNCWSVKGPTTDPTTIEGGLTGAIYEDCFTCQSQLGQYCKRG
jgi:hypothetical protein